MAERGIIAFTRKSGYQYLEDRYNIMAKTQKNNLSKNDIAVIRTVRMLNDFIETGIVVRDYKKREDIFANPEHISLLVSYDKYCATLEYVPSTLRSFHRHISNFLLFVEQNKKEIKDADHELIACYLRYLHTCSEGTKSGRISNLRTFLRFIYENHITPIDLSASLPKTIKYKRKRVLSVWTKDEVLLLLNAIDRNYPLGKRDYAIILLIARSGIRDGDVRNLKFENFSWNTNEISFIQGKTNEPLVLPLLKDVGWAVIDYIENGRPKVSLSEVFLRHIVLIAPLDGSMFKVFEKYMKLSGIPPAPKRKLGMHSLRHSLASSMLQQHIELPYISNILGHKNMESTSAYLQTGIELLRECTLVLPGVMK